MENVSRSFTLPEPVPSLSNITRTPEDGRERAGFVSMDRNERLSPLPDYVVEAVRAGIDSTLLTEYPSIEDVYEDLARFLDTPRERLLLTAGSDAAFRALSQAYVRPGDRVVMLDPSYAMYPVYTRMFGAEPVQVPFRADLTLDPDALLDATTTGVRMVLLANPNQPTGTRLADDVLRALLDRAEACDALVVVDEAYFPFSRTTVLPWIAEHPHLAVTRTFSKAWGLAGMRIGAVAAHPDVVANLYKVRSAYDVTAVGAVCLRTLLSHPEVAEQFVAEVDAGRRVVVDRASAIGLEPVPGETNFQVLRCAGLIEPARLAGLLRERGYLVKGPFTAPCLADCIRITLGPPALMARFCDVLEEVLGGH